MFLDTLIKTSMLDSLITKESSSGIECAADPSPCPFYGCLGDKVKITKGESKGKKGTIVAKKEHSKDETYLDDEGYEISKRKETNTYEVKTEDGSELTFDGPDCGLERYYEDEKEAAAACDSANKNKKSDKNKDKNEKKAMYCCMGDRVKVVSGDSKGKKGKVVSRVSTRESHDYIDDDGDEVHKNKNNEKVTVDTEDGKVEVDSNEVEMDNDKLAHVGNSDLNPYRESIYKISVSRILNGDMALDDMINTFSISESEYKSAESDTSKAKKPDNEEGFPKGEDNDGDQEALRVPTSDTNISTEDDVKEKQDD